MASENESRMVSGARELVGHEVLVVDGDDQVHRGLLQALAPEGLHLTAVVDPEKALELVATKFFGVVVIDLDTPTAGAGVELVGQVHERSPQSMVIMLTPRKSFEGVLEAFRRGARDVIWKSPEQADYLRQRIVDAAGDVRNRGGQGTLLAEVREVMDEFLKAFMGAERRAQDLEDKISGRAERPEVDEEMRLLCVDADERVYKALKAANIPGFSFTYAQSGGEALDRISSSRYHLALVGPSMHDLPADMVIKAIKAQVKDLILISYVPNGKLQIVESTRMIPLVDKFHSAKQLTDRLAELAEAHRAKGRERRYLQAFRERHFEFLRRFAELKQKLEKAG